MNLACEMMMFGFGDFALHAQCFTRIIRGGDILASTLDYQNWDGETDTNNDEWYFVEKYRPEIIGGRVTNVEISPVNDVLIELDNGVRIEIYVSNGFFHYGEDREQWVFFKPEDESHPFISVNSKSIRIE